MPKPKPDEDHDTYMKRCQGMGHTEKECQAFWEEEHPPADAARRLHIRMVGDDTAEMLLYDQIGTDSFFGGGISAKEFREQVKAIKAKTLNLRVNSPGGSVFEADAMIAALDGFKGKVVVDVDGLAASAASYLIMAADTIRLGTNAMMMIHDPYGGKLGNADDMRAMAEILDKKKSQILDAYERKSKAGREQLSAWMTAETWFTGSEAVDAGLADSVTEPVRVAALARHAPALAKLHYRHAPPLPEDTAAWEATRKRMEIAARLTTPAR